MFGTFKLTQLIQDIKYDRMTTVKWYLSFTGPLPILKFLHILILDILSIRQQDNEFGALYFAMR